MRRWIFVFCMMLLAGCGAPDLIAARPTEVPTPAPKCNVVAADFLKQVEPLAREWDDTVTLANSTPRMQLAAQIAKLQDIQRRTEALQPPKCAAAAQEYLIRQMNATNRAFVAFLGEKPESMVNNIFALVQEQQEAFTRAVRQLKAGDPVPDPPSLYSDGLGVTRDSVQAAYAKAELKFDNLGNIHSMGTSKDGLLVVDILGPMENVQQVTASGTMKGASEAQQKAIAGFLQTLLQTVMPDWVDGGKWLTAAMDANPQTQVIADRGRVVTYERSNSGTTTWTISIRVPTE